MRLRPFGHRFNGTVCVSRSQRRPCPRQE
jgi:hypothetical protein